MQLGLGGKKQRGERDISHFGFVQGQPPISGSAKQGPLARRSGSGSENVSVWPGNDPNSRPKNWAPDLPRGPDIATLLGELWQR